MSVQTSIPFKIRKKNFYSNKDNTSNLDFNNISLKSTSTRYTPTIKKMVDISSESESDSNEENMNKNNNIIKTPKRTQRKTNKNGKKK
jgi:cell division control protein 6